MRRKRTTKKKEVQPTALKPYLTLSLLLELLRKGERKEKTMKKLNAKLKTLLFAVVGSAALLVSVSIRAQDVTVPHLINFQSVLTDAAGVPLSDGLYDISFRIVDPSGVELYQETQALETYKGVASAMVGAAGELDLSLLDPSTPRFLGVQVQGNGPETLLEIVTVPYSMFAEQALNVAPESIGTEAIQPGAITRDLLADEVLDNLSATIIQQTQVNIDNQSTILNQRINTEVSILQTEDARLQTEINQEATTRTQADVSLQGQMEGLSQQVDTLDTNVDTTTSRIDTLETNVNSLMEPPKVVAAGIVIYPSEFDADLSWGYNVSQVLSSVEARGTPQSFTGSAASAGIFFQNPIDPPYIVQLTSTGAVANNFLYVSDTSDTRFVVDYPTGSIMVPFHFVVFK